MSLIRYSASLSAFSICVATSGMGSAADSKQPCVQAYEDAQTAKRKGKLLQATSDLLLCGSTACPEAMHGYCQGWLTEVEASIPTVVFRVTTASGATPQWATASVDGDDPVVLDGRAISVDPGRHTVTFSAQDLRPQSKTFDFSEGEKLRREVILLEPTNNGRSTGATELPQLAPAEHNSAFRLTLPFTLAASATVLGTLGATYFGLTARADDRKLDDCSPNCTREAVDRVRREYLLTNVSLGIAAVGLVTTTFVVLLQSRSEPASSSVRVALDASAHQLKLSLGGRF